MQFIKQCLLVIFLYHAAGCSAVTSDTDFQVYWGKFRAASLTSDYFALANLTKFPLEVKGVDDSSPVLVFGKNELDKIFPKLMAQTIYQYKGENLIETTLKDVLLKTEKVVFNADDTNIRIEQFEFKLINGKWFLIRAYLEE